jgi:cation:H+ antiporter
MVLNLLYCLAGFLLLYFGAEWLVKGSSSLARNLGITPIVIGLTVVAFGTSAPELVISLFASIQDKSMIAVGNVIGSNICNIALILGLAALFQPISGSESVVKRDIPVMLVISFYLLIISLDSQLGRIEGASLFGGVILYIFFNYYLAIKQSAKDKAGDTGIYESGRIEIGYVSSRSKQILLIIVGIAGVITGAQIVIPSAIKIMKILGVNEKFIGLTIVAFGTSLPELATSIVAAIRQEMDISIGNLIGSNVFNILSVLGAASLVRPIPITGGFIESGLIIDYVFMMFTSFLPWVMMRNSLTVGRKGGMILLVCYIGYILYLIIYSG